MAPKQQTKAKIGPLGPQFRGVQPKSAYTYSVLAGLEAIARQIRPRTQIRNPVMFVVWVGSLVTLALTIDPTLFGPSSALASTTAS